MTCSWAGPAAQYLELAGVDHHMHQRPSLLAAFEQPWGGCFSQPSLQALIEFYRAQT